MNLRVDLRIDASYVPDMNQRLMLYRKVAAARHDEEIDRVLEESTDRYGPLPDSVLNLADYGRIRVMADRLGIDTIDREGRIVVLKFRPQAKVDPVRLVALVRRRPRADARPACGSPAVARRRRDSGFGLGGNGGSRDRRPDGRRAPIPAPSPKKAARTPASRRAGGRRAREPAK